LLCPDAVVADTGERGTAQEIFKRVQAAENGMDRLIGAVGVFMKIRSAVRRLYPIKKKEANYAWRR
jgi:hypothetical protein